MTRRITLIACCCALGLGAVHAQRSLGRATTRAARPTMISPTVAQQQPVPPLVARAAVGEASVTLTTLAARERSPSTPHRTATPTRDGSLTVGQDKRADAPARSDVLIRLRLSPADRVAAARWALVESSAPLRNDGEPDEDTRALLQTVRGFASFAGRSHARALHDLAPHVAGSRAPLLRRHALYRQLPAIGNACPLLWTEATDGPWSSYQRAWASFRAHVFALVRDGFVGPCPVDPVAEGNEHDAGIARARGFVRLACGKRVQFWVPAGTVVAASDARGVR